ncbi:MAG: chorismate mutase, partial [Acidobacteriota bacterium]
MTDRTPAEDAEAQQVVEELGQLREQIAEVDRSLLELLHRRMDLAERVGRVKHEAGRPIVVPEVHGRVLTRARQHADACGVSEEVMESIFDAVMRGSVERQHRLGVALEAGTDERMLIVGGRGNMGIWLEDFLQRLGHPVDIVDTALKGLPTAEGRFGTLDEIDNLDDYRAIWVSVPLGHMPDVLEQVVELRPKAQII